MSKLQMRFFLAIIALLLATVVALAIGITTAATSEILAQTEDDGVAIAQLLARSASFALRVPRQVEDIVGDQMVVEARIAAHMVAIAERRAGMSAEEIRAVLRDITGNSVLSEFWITDARGWAYLTNTDIDFTFDPDPVKEPQAYVFYELLSQKNGKAIQDTRKRDYDARVFKYAGVSGADGPRIVQVGYEADVLEELSRDVSLQRMVDELTGQGTVAAIRIVDGKLEDLAASAHPVRSIDRDLDADGGSDADHALLQAALSSRQVRSQLRDDLLRVAVPLVDEHGAVPLVALVFLLTDGVQAATNGAIARSVGLAVAVVLVGALASYFLSSGITKPIRRLTAVAQSLERGEPFEPASVSALAGQKDELANLARVFGRMALEVQAREKKLQQEVAGLRIEIDQAKRAKQVAEVTETDYFQALRKRARELRDDVKDGTEA